MGHACKAQCIQQCCWKQKGQNTNMTMQQYRSKLSTRSPFEDCICKSVQINKADDSTKSMYGITITM